MIAVRSRPRVVHKATAWWLWSTTALIVLSLPIADASIEIPTSTSSVPTCDVLTEYYDDAVLGCNRCVGATGGATTPSSLLIPNANALNSLGISSSCTCKEAAYWTSYDDSHCASTWPAPCNLDVCTTCPTGLVPSRDALRCMSCGNSTLGIDSATKDCECPSNAILVEESEAGEQLPAKECIVCVNDTRRDLITNKCIACADPEMVLVDDGDGGKTCECGSGYQYVRSTVLGVSKCIAQTRSAILGTKVNLNLASVVTFADFDAEETGSADTTVSMESDLVRDMFLLASSECYFYRSEKQNGYCQALGNLCVLQHFSPTAAPCALYDLIQKSGRATTANNINGWFYTLPFLYYHTNAPSVLKSTNIDMKMSFDATSIADTADHLEFILATYAVNGTLKGFSPLSNQLLYCLDGSAVASASSSPLWTRYGVGTTSHFSCDLSSLSSDAMELYELLLIDKSKGEHEDGRYVSVPVQNLNYADARGLELNRNHRKTEDDDDLLSNRFFLFDVASGVRVGESKTKVYRYADSITITIRSQDTAVDKIYPPLLTISYVDTQTPSDVSIKFQVIYASNTKGFWSSAVTIFVISCAIAGARVILHTFTWQRRNTRNEEMALTAWHSISHLLTSILSNYARGCFLVLFLLCLYFLLFFKLQSSVFILLPEMNSQLESARKDEYYPFRVILPLAFAFQLATMLHLIYQQTHVQLFFIDWEKPRAKIIEMDASSIQQAPVSVWRTILVANEWNELQTVRRTSLRFTLLVLLFLLYGCDLRSLALPIPQAQMGHLTTKATTASTLATDQDLALNHYLRFASVASLWLLLCIAQRLWKWLIYERFFDEPREHMFIDLCTVAKVSCFILDETYHGFYLHCRSPYPFADGSMGEIVEQLKQEEAGLTVGRGLDSSIPDCQTFEVFLTRKWKRKYLNLFNAIHGSTTAGGDSRRNINGAEEASPRRSFSPTRGGRGGHPLRRPHNARAMSLWQQSGSFVHGWQSSSGTFTTQGMVTHAVALSDFLKGFIENQDDQFRWRMYRMETCFSRFFGIPPEMSSTRQSFFLPDTDARFTRIIFLGVENDLMLMNILCFTAFDLWLNNHAVSALATYVLECLLSGLRAHFGNQNVARNSLVDSRFLI